MSNLRSTIERGFPTDESGLFTSRENTSGQELVGFDVFVARLRHDVLGQRGGGLALSQPVVSSQSRTNCLSNDGCGPPGRYDCFGQYRELSGVSTSSTSSSSPVWLVEPPLELGVGQDQASRRRRARRRSDRPPGSSIVTSSATSLPTDSAMNSNETFSSWPVSALVAGVKIGSIAWLSTRPAGSAMPQTVPDGPVFLPGAAGEVAANDALERNDPGLAHHHRAAAERLALGGGQLEPGGVDVGRDQVVGDLQMLEPVHGEARQDPPLVGDAVGQHPVERADAIGRDQQEPIAQVVNVADLAAPLGERLPSPRLVSSRTMVQSSFHFLSTISRKVSPRKIQLDGAAEIGPLIPKTAIW